MCCGQTVPDKELSGTDEIITDGYGCLFRMRCDLLNLPTNIYASV
jgi:hypothetical protein